MGKIEKCKNVLQSRIIKFLFQANKDRHDQYKFEQKLLRLEFLLSRKIYLDAQVIKANDALAGKSATGKPL